MRKMEQWGIDCKKSQFRSYKLPPRLSWLDILKGIGIILVVVGHVFSNSTVFDWLYSFHMPLFFLAAGWLYRKKSVLSDIKRRFQTIVVPYFSFGLLVLLYWAVLERHFRDSSMTVMESFVGLLRGQYDYLDFNVHLWFLPCFFMTVILYNALMNINRKAAYGVAILMSVVYIISPLPQLPWGIDRIFKYIGFYAVGNILAESRVDKLVCDWLSGGTANIALNGNGRAITSKIFGGGYWLQY